MWDRLKFHEAGTSHGDQLEAALVSAELDREYLRVGLLDVEGMTIDNAPVSIETLIDGGPEALCHEIINCIKRELGLSDDERKN